MTERNDFDAVLAQLTEALRSNLKSRYCNGIQVPEFHQVTGFRIPNQDEFYLDAGGAVLQCGCIAKRDECLIVEKIPAKRIVFRQRMENGKPVVRTVEPGEYFSPADGGIIRARLRGTNAYPIFDRFEEDA